MGAYDGIDHCSSEETRQSLEDRLMEFSAHMNAAEYQLIHLLDEFDRANGWQGDGICSFAHWLNWKLGMGAMVAREKVRVARALRVLPKTREAFRLGELSYTKVRAITRAGTPENETFFLQIARHGTANHLEQLVRKFKRAKVRMDDEVEERWKADATFSYWIDEDGFLVFRGRLPPDDGELLVNAIEQMQASIDVDRQQESEADVSAETFKESVEIDEDTSHNTSRAAALVAITEPLRC